MSNFHLRPVSERSASPSTSTTSDHTPPPHRDAKQPVQTFLPPHSASSSRPRRPLSPSSLRDVDLSRDRETAPRRYPVPPTGHELMALFPPAPPIGVIHGPTSGYFQKEERAFFAQAGREIVRVRIEVDVPQNGEGEGSGSSRGKGREHAPHAAVPRHWMPPPPPNLAGQGPPHPHPHQHPRSPAQGSPHTHLPPAPFPHPNANRLSRGGPVPVTTHPAFPVASHGNAQPPVPPNAHSPPSMQQHPGYPLRTPPHEQPHIGNQVEQRQNDFRDDPDESWRRPMPHNERRRAGKHTKRVIVK